MKPKKPNKFQWRRIFSLGVVNHPAGDFEVTPVFVDGLIAAFNYFAKKYGYHPPVVWDHQQISAAMTDDTKKMVAEHKALHPGGVPYGLIDRMRRTEDGGVEVRIELTPLGIQWWDSIKHISPNVYLRFQHPHEKQTFGPLLRELSAVTVPHLKNISHDMRLLEEANYQLAEAGLPSKPQQEKKMDSEEILEAIRAELAPTHERLEALEAKGVDDPEETPAPNAEDPEETPMSEQAQTRSELRKLRAEVAISRAESAIVRELGEIATGDENLVRTLAEVRVNQGEAAYKTVAKSLIRTMSEKEQPPIGKAGSTVDIPGGKKAKRRMSDDEFVRACAEHISRGVKPTELNDVLSKVERLDSGEILEKKKENREAINTLYDVYREGK